MTAFGKYFLPEELCAGSSFSGFQVVSGAQTESGYVWVFARNNHAMVLSMPYDEFFDLISNGHSREYLMDAMAMELHRRYSTETRLSTTQSN